MRRQVHVDGIIVPQELLHFGAVVELQEGAEAPHQHKDVEPLVQRLVDGGFLVIAGGYESLQKVAGLANDERLENVHFERQILYGEAEEFGEGSLE
jgi:hypothetical protein